MIVFSANPGSIIRAALLAELTGQSPSPRDGDRQQNLFDASNAADADEFSLNELLVRLSQKTGRDYSWLNNYQGRRLAVMILFNLRNACRDCVPGIFAALREALRLGPGHCLDGRGPAGSAFRKRSREVGNEIHRMMGLIRFSETANGDLVAHPRLFHRTADILLRKFQPRYPDRQLFFLLPDGVLCCRQGRVFPLDVQELPASLLNVNDDFNAAWETYYRSQYIPGRKNIRLAARHIPKRYWDWLQEGKILEQEAKR